MRTKSSSPKPPVHAAAKRGPSRKARTEEPAEELEQGSAELEPAYEEDEAAPLPEGRAKTALRRPRVLLIFNFCWDDAKVMLMGISRYAHGNWDVLIDAQGAAIEESWWVKDSDWDGVITRHSSPSLIEACRARRIPLIDIDDTPPVPGVPKIRPDNIAVGHMGAEHLLERGFKHFAFCGLTESWAKERAKGFVEALELAGKTCSVFEADYRTVDPRYDEEQLHAIKDWLRSLPRPLGLMCCNDLRALQVVSACQKAELLVPNEIAVLGANNDYIRCAFGSPPLSSVATDRQLAGYRAAELLDRMMATGVHFGVDDIRIDPIRVVVRQSTDVLAISDRVTSAAVHYIHQYACRGISADDVAQHVGISRHVLERKFRHFLARSPHMEIRLVQIARIKQLLMETDMPLKNIADIVGIPHTEYVNVMFSRHVGVTPGMYRRAHQPKGPHTRLTSSTNPDLKEEF